MAEQTRPTNNLREIKRFITDHNAEGLAVFNNDVPEVIPHKVLPMGDEFRLGYVTTETPVDLSKDVPKYQSYLTNNPGLSIQGGSVLRVVDIVPGGISPMHRTVSLDYGIVVEGAVELVLDSGEVRLMERGDIAVQRGTMHQWRNASKTEYSRVAFVLQESKPIDINGATLKEDYGVGMGDVPASAP